MTEEEKKNGFQYHDYQASDAVQKAEDLLNQQIANKPGEYQSQWEQQLKDTLDKIMNRPDFSYDPNGDALYQQYKDQYTSQGKMAMIDTMGQAQAMTGGYGNSYAQSVGQQAYQGYLQEMNGIIPELYQLAMNKYQMDIDALNNQYALLQQQENMDYGRYQDLYNAWLAERDYLTGRYDSERSYDYGKYTDDRDFSYGQYIADRDYAFQQQQAEEAKRQWEAEFEEAKRQYDQNYALNASRSSRSSGSGGYRSSGSSSGSSSWGSGISTDNGGKSSGGVTGSAWALTKNNLRQNLASGNYDRAEQYLNQIIDQVNESQYNEIVDLFDKYGR